jgi:hypothetical protein
MVVVRLHQRRIIKAMHHLLDLPLDLPLGEFSNF